MDYVCDVCVTTKKLNTRGKIFKILQTTNLKNVHEV